MTHILSGNIQDAPASGRGLDVAIAAQDLPPSAQMINRAHGLQSVPSLPVQLLQLGRLMPDWLLAAPRPHDLGIGPWGIVCMLSAPAGLGICLEDMVCTLLTLSAPVDLGIGPWGIVCVLSAPAGPGIGP